MNVFNRIVVCLLLVALVAGAIAIAVLAWTIPNDSIAGLRDAVNWLNDHNQDFERAVLSASVIGIVFVCLVLLAMELLPSSNNDVKVIDLQAGNAYLSTAAIAQRVEEAVSQVPHVADVKANVAAKKKGVRVNLDLHVAPEANLAAVTDDACAAATDVLTNRVHVTLLEAPRVRLHYRELRMQRAAAARRPIAMMPPPPAAERAPEAAPPAPAEARPSAFEETTAPVTNGTAPETSPANAATAVEERPASEGATETPAPDSKAEDK